MLRGPYIVVINYHINLKVDRGNGLGRIDLNGGVLLDALLLTYLGALIAITKHHPEHSSVFVREFIELRGELLGFSIFGF